MKLGMGNRFTSRKSPSTRPQHARHPNVNADSSQDVSNAVDKGTVVLTPGLPVPASATNSATRERPPHSPDELKQHLTSTPVSFPTADTSPSGTAQRGADELHWGPELFFAMMGNGVGSNTTLGLEDWCMAYTQALLLLMREEYPRALDTLSVLCFRYPSCPHLLLDATTRLLSTICAVNPNLDRFGPEYLFPRVPSSHSTQGDLQSLYQDLLNDLRIAFGSRVDAATRIQCLSIQSQLPISNDRLFQHAFGRYMTSLNEIALDEFSHLIHCLSDNGNDVLAIDLDAIIAGPQ